MKDVQKFVGLDVSKEMISVGVAEAGRGEPRFHGNIPNQPEAIRKLMRKLGNPEDLHVCYEAGSTGYGIVRFLLSYGYRLYCGGPYSYPPSSWGSCENRSQRFP